MQVLLAPLVAEKSTFVGERTTSTYSACWRRDQATDQAAVE